MPPLGVGRVSQKQTFGVSGLQFLQAMFHCCSQISNIKPLFTGITTDIFSLNKF